MNKSISSESMNAHATGVESLELNFKNQSRETSAGDGLLDWLKPIRQVAAGVWRGKSFPTRKNERWKYTRLSALSESRLVSPSLANPAKVEALLPQLKVEAAAQVVFLNGRYVSELSSVSQESGLLVSTLSDLLAQSGSAAGDRQQLLKEFRDRVIASSGASHETTDNMFPSLNSSFMENAVVIQVAKNVVLRKPVLVIYLSESVAEPGEIEMNSPRMFVKLGTHAELGLVELYAGQGAAYFTNSVSDLVLEAGAKLAHCKVQIEGAEGVHVGTTSVHQARDTFSESYQFSMGGRLSRHNLAVKLAGEGSEAIVDGLYMAHGSQHVDNFTTIEHLVPHTTSEQIYKGILNDEARAVFNGRVFIQKDAQKSNASQLNNNLMLSMKAEVDTKPELEIYADDVKAAHGATVGQLDPEHVFYLQARAVSKKDAIRILARGFAQDVVFRIRNEAIRSMMRNLVDQQFDALHVGEF